MSLFSAQRFRTSLRDFLLGRAAQSAASLVFTLAAVRLLDATSYGAYIVLLGLVDLFRPLGSLGVHQMIQQFLPEMALHATPQQFRRFVARARLACWGMLGLCVGTLYLLWQQAAAWMGFDLVGPVPAWLPCMVIVSLLATEFVEQLLEALLSQKTVQLLRLLYAVGHLGAMLVCAAAGTLSLKVMLLIDAVTALICWGIAEWSLWRSLRRVQPDGSRHFKRDELLRFAAHMAGWQVLDAFAGGGFLRVIVARTLSLEAAGLFGFMHTLVLQVNRLMPAVLLAGLIRPMLIARRAQGQVTSVMRACALLLRSNALLLWPLIPVVYVGRDTFARALSGGRLEDGLALFAMFLALTTINQTQVSAIILQIQRRSGALLLASSVALLAPLLVAGGTVLFGLAGAAFGLFAAFGLRSSLSNHMARNFEEPMETDLKGMLAYALAVAAAAAAALLLRPVLGDDGAALLYVLALLALLPVVKPLNRNDVALIKDVSGRDLRCLRWIASSARP